jgi:hypothetical protein
VKQETEKETSAKHGSKQQTKDDRVFEDKSFLRRNIGLKNTGARTDILISSAHLYLVHLRYLNNL